MTSLSHDPFRFPFLPNAKFIGYVEPSGEGRSLVFPRLICGFDLQGESPRLAGYLKIFQYILRSRYANELRRMETLVGSRKAACRPDGWRDLTETFPEG